MLALLPAVAVRSGSHPSRPPLPPLPSPHPGAPQVKADEWEAIPDIGDYTVKRPKRETFAPAPDSLLAAATNAAGATGGATALDVNGLATPAGTASSLTDMGARPSLARPSRTRPGTRARPAVATSAWQPAFHACLHARPPRTHPPHQARAAPRCWA